MTQESDEDPHTTDLNNKLQIINNKAKGTYLNNKLQIINNKECWIGIRHLALGIAVSLVLLVRW
jgi:hypothetical protein